MGPIMAKMNIQLEFLYISMYIDVKVYGNSIFHFVEKVMLLI